MRNKLTKEQISEIRQYILENRDQWHRNKDRMLALKYRVAPQCIVWQRKKLGVGCIVKNDIAKFIKEHPTMSVKEIAQDCGVCETTIRIVDKQFGLNMLKKKKRLNLTQSDVEGKTFKQVKAELGVSDSYLCHIKHRYNLILRTPQKGEEKRKRCGRKNICKFRRAKAEEIALLLSEKPWCIDEQCDHDCYLCCKKWLEKREK